VLRYRQHLTKQTEVVEAVLVTENKPIDTAWSELCARVDVRLVWPRKFTGLIGSGKE